MPGVVVNAPADDSPSPSGDVGEGGEVQGCVETSLPPNPWIEERFEEALVRAAVGLGGFMPL